MNDQNARLNKMSAVLDNGNFLRGLLLLIKKDNKIQETEASIFFRTGKELGFDREFCEEAIRNLLRNDFINSTPPYFHNKSTALKFLQVGISLIQTDIESRHNEMKFLETVAKTNEINRFWEKEKAKINILN